MEFGGEFGGWMEVFEGSWNWGYKDWKNYGNYRGYVGWREYGGWGDDEG